MSAIRKTSLHIDHETTGYLNAVNIRFPPKSDDCTNPR